MRTLLLILGTGLVMCAVALVGGVTLSLSEHTMRRLRRPIVALAAGSLLGASFFHMLPAAVDAMGNRTAAWGMGRRRLRPAVRVGAVPASRTYASARSRRDLISSISADMGRTPLGAAPAYCAMVAWLRFR